MLPPRSVLVAVGQIVDECPLVRSVQRGQIADETIEIRTYAEALDILTNSAPSFDLLMVDCYSGIEPVLPLLKEVSATERLRDLPVVIMTDPVSEEEIVRVYQEGADSVVVLPSETADREDLVVHTLMYWLLINRRPARSRVFSQI